MGFAFPYMFAGIWANVPRFDLGGADWDLEQEDDITDRYQTIWGTTEQNLPTPDITGDYPECAATGEGYNVYERMDQIYTVSQNPGLDFPCVNHWRR